MKNKSDNTLLATLGAGHAQNDDVKHNTKVEDIMQPKVAVRKSKEVLEIERQLQLHYEALGEMNKLSEGIQETVDKIKKIESTEKSRLKRIIKDAVMIDKDVFTIKGYVATLCSVPKYKSPQPSYKDLWYAAVEAVGSKIKKKFQIWESKMVQDKTDEKVLEFVFQRKDK